MENLDTRINKMDKYPNEETMKLFLEIWNKLYLFKTADVKKPDGKTEVWYENINAITTLSIVAEYLSKPENIKEKELLIQKIESWDTESYKYLWNLALDIRSNNSPSQFWLSMIRSNREKISKQAEWSDIFFPIITHDQLPSRYENHEPTHLIHEEFEAELARLDWIKSWADKIQAESENHTFNRWNNSDQISNLKSKL